MEVVLQADHLRQFVGLEQGVKGDIHSHARGALRAGEQLDENHRIGL
jgi:hypothetical protein